MSENKFLAGLEEGFARIIALVLTLIFFLIYTAAVEQVTLNWLQALAWLGLFWFVYEVISFLLFSVFTFFARNKIAKQDSNTESNQKVAPSSDSFMADFTEKSSENDSR